MRDVVSTPATVLPDYRINAERVSEVLTEKRHTGSKQDAASYSCANSSCPRKFPSRCRSFVFSAERSPEGNGCLKRMFSWHERNPYQSLRKKRSRSPGTIWSKPAKSTTPKWPVGYCWTLSRKWSDAVKDARWLCRTALSRFTNALERRVWRPSPPASASRCRSPVARSARYRSRRKTNPGPHLVAAPASQVAAPASGRDIDRIEVEPRPVRSPFGIIGVNSMVMV